MSSNREAAHALARQLGLCGNLDGVVFIGHDEECDAITAALDTREAETKCDVFEDVLELIDDDDCDVHGTVRLWLERAEEQAKAARQGATGGKR